MQSLFKQGQGMRSSGQLMEFDKKYKCKVKRFSMSDIKLKYFKIFL